MRRVAVCLGGLLRLLPQVGPSIQANLVTPLDAEVFIAGPLSDVASWAAALALFPTLQQVRLESENVTEFLRNAPGGDLGWKAAATIPGNWLGCFEGQEPEMRRTGSGLCQIYGQRQCWHMVVDREAKRGAPFEHVVYSRADLHWLGPHPPLSLRPDGESDFWIVDGEDNGGINDRHWLMPRWLAEELLTSWDRIVDGSAARLLLAQGLPEVSLETYFNYILASKGYLRLVRRIPCMAFVPCANPHGRKNIDMSATSWEDSGRIDNVNVRCEIGGPKYRHEYRHARHVVECLGPRPWSLPLLWECWCAAKVRTDALQYQEYRLCVHAWRAAVGYTQNISIIDPEDPF